MQKRYMHTAAHIEKHYRRKRIEAV